MLTRLYCLLLCLPLAAQAATVASTYREIEAKVALENSLEKRLEAVLQKVLDTEDLVVILNVQMQSEADSKDGEIMPGVPRQDSSAFPGLLDPTRTVVRRVSANILIGPSSSEEDIQLVKTTAERLLGLMPERGDKLLVERANFRKQAAASEPFLQKMLQPAILLSAGWLIIALFCFFWLYRKFLDPLIATIRDLFIARQGQINEPAKREFEEPAADPEPAPSAPAPTAGVPDSEPLPFSFIQDGDLPTLAWMLNLESAEVAAVVIHYLPPALAARALATLEPQRRQEVSALLGSVTELDPEQVRAVEQSIKSRVHYLMGGEDKIVEILTNCAPSLQQQILESLAMHLPELSERLNRRLVRLEDLLSLSEAELKRLARQVPVKSLAAVFKSNPQLGAQLLPKLRSGLGEWLAQEIELHGELSPAAAEEEQKRLLTALTELARAGKVRLQKELGSQAPSTTPPARLNLFKNGKRPPLAVPAPAQKSELASESAAKTFIHEISVLERELQGIELPKE